MPFDPEQLRKTYVYDSCVPFDAMSAELAQIEVLAARWRKSRHRLLFWGIVLLVCGFFSLFVYPLAALVLVPAGIALLFSMKRYPKGVANGIFRCESTKAIAGVLALDTKPGH